MKKGISQDRPTDEELRQMMETGRQIFLSIFTIDMPETIHAFSTYRGKRETKDLYWIFLNGKENETQNAASFIHECLHIYHEDHERNDLTADQIEALRHAETLAVVQELKNREK